MLFKYNLHFNPQNKHPSSFFATHLALVLAHCYQPQNSQMFVRTQNWWWQGRSPHIAYIVLIMRLVSESFIFVLFFAFQQYQPLIMDLTIYHKVYADVRISQQTVQECSQGRFTNDHKTNLYCNFCLVLIALRAWKKCL